MVKGRLGSSGCASRRDNFVDFVVDDNASEGSTSISAEDEASDSAADLQCGADIGINNTTFWDGTLGLVEQKLLQGLAKQGDAPVL